MLGVMTGCWDSYRHVRLIVLGVEFFHAGIGDLFSAMLQSTSTTVIDLGQPVSYETLTDSLVFWGVKKGGTGQERRKLQLLGNIDSQLGVHFQDGK